MPRPIEQIEQELLNLQQDRMRIINENEARFKKLENTIDELQKSSDAQITVNKLFQKQLTELEIRLKKEEIKPLVAIPANPTTWIAHEPKTLGPKTSFLNRIFNKK